MDDEYVERWSSNFEGDVFVDVGAFDGRYTLRLASHFRKVVSFEPDSGPRGRLMMEVPSNVCVRREAVSNLDGVGNLYRHGGELASLSNPHPMYGNMTPSYEVVRTIRLDSLDWASIGRVDFLKVDTEGEELRVLEGARDLIGSEKPKIQIETHRDADIQSIVWFLKALRYNNLEIVKQWILGYR